MGASVFWLVSDAKYLEKMQERLNAKQVSGEEDVYDLRGKGDLVDSYETSKH